LILIITMSWRCYSDAPRLAAVARSWKEAAKEAEKMVRGEDVPVPRLCITLPLLPPLEPILSTAERAVRVSWGAAFEAYTPFVVKMPAAGFHVRCEYELEDIKSTVLSGLYLNSVTINSFLSSLMPDMVQATSSTRSAPKRPRPMPRLTTRFPKGQKSRSGQRMRKCETAQGQPEPGD
jgi:hypothetical protein